MTNSSNSATIGIVGAGTMGTGIAQVAASAGRAVIVTDSSESALDRSRASLADTFKKLVAKGKVSDEDSKKILDRISHSRSADSFSSCDVVIEAVVEDLHIKKEILSLLESKTSSSCILASNTSSLSITALAGACKEPERVIGIHFFNPAPLMSLVEVVPSLMTSQEVVDRTKKLVAGCGKKGVIAKDTPGFIVNRIARPYYGESIRIYEEGFASPHEIDWAMKEIGGFKMGPFELMDLIGNDINFTVTCSVYDAFFQDPRFRPSLTQKRLVEAGWLGRKSGRGYFKYGNGVESPKVKIDKEKGEKIADRVITMLINEAVDALFLGVASREDIDLAMTLGTNYPRGLLKWCDEIGSKEILRRMDELSDRYREDRYRASPLLREMSGRTFY